MSCEVDQDNPPFLPEALLSMSHTWRYGIAGGAIVCDCPPGCSVSGGDTERFYGGHFVTESMSAELAAAIITAVVFRQAHTLGPKIVTLCGSTRFYEAWQQAIFDETVAGKIVLSVGFYPHAADKAHAAHVGITPEQKVALDALHLRKIEISDEVLILNVCGYIGESTANELAHARRLGKVVRFLEPER
jgi:hypothetical protein